MNIKTISEPLGTVKKIWTSEFNTNERYRPLSYLLFQEVKDGLLVQNSVTGELIHTDKDTWNNLAVEDLKTLVEKHFLVPESFNDKKYIDQLRKILPMAIRKKGITKYVVFPTTSCNARCFYCFESDIKHISMTQEVADKTVEYIVKSSMGQRVTLSWFGGEPMLGIKTIDYICDKLRDKGVEFVSSMTSNGYLFSKEIAEHAKIDWNLKSIQITLDGTEEIYNKTKAYVGKQEISPYHRVLNNIEYLSENNIRVAVRLNLGNHNYEDLSRLLDELAERYKNKSNIYLYCAILFDDAGFEPQSFDENTLENLINRQEEINNKISLSDFKNSYASLPVLKVKFCMADNDNCINIISDGKLGKCESCFDMFVGDLDKGITDREMVKRWKEPVFWGICNTCELYPSCYQLKLCGTRRKCNELMRDNKIANIKKTMVSKYIDFKEVQISQEYEETEMEFDT